MSDCEIECALLDTRPAVNWKGATGQRQLVERITGNTEVRGTRSQFLVCLRIGISRMYVHHCSAAKEVAREPKSLGQPLPDYWKAAPGDSASRRRSCLTRSIWVESLSNAFLAR